MVGRWQGESRASIDSSKRVVCGGVAACGQGRMAGCGESDAAPVEGRLWKGAGGRAYLSKVASMLRLVRAGGADDPLPQGRRRGRGADDPKRCDPCVARALADVVRATREPGGKAVFE